MLRKVLGIIFWDSPKCHVLLGDHLEELGSLEDSHTRFFRTTPPAYGLVCVPPTVVVELLLDAIGSFAGCFDLLLPFSFVGSICRPCSRLALFQNLHIRKVGTEILDRHPENPIHSWLEVHLFGHLGILLPLLRGIAPIARVFLLFSPRVANPDQLEAMALIRGQQAIRMLCDQTISDFAFVFFFHVLEIGILLRDDASTHQVFVGVPLLQDFEEAFGREWALFVVWALHGLVLLIPVNIEVLDVEAGLHLAPAGLAEFPVVDVRVAGARHYLPTLADKPAIQLHVVAPELGKSLLQDAHPNSLVRGVHVDQWLPFVSHASPQVDRHEGVNLHIDPFL
mmetsp:Transcript_48497/g.113655  ORF Transcript_48497/g.113655 Transcript_48497/m.113655 type:complete len:338 (-) Transcript_48497:472-1485(-)